MLLQGQAGHGQLEIEVSDEVFASPMNEALVHQVIVAYMAASRQGSKAQKSRSEVSGGGKKPWRQKGTGRARAGTTRSPIWRTGGVTFAAKPRSFTQKINRKMYQGAMCCILSQLVRDNRLLLTPEISITSPKTKIFIEWLKQFETQDALILVNEISSDLILASRNVPNVLMKPVSSIDPVSLINFEKVIIAESAVKLLDERFRKVKSKEHGSLEAA